MKIFYDERGKNGKYFELQDVEDFPKMKKIKGIFADITKKENFNFNYSLENVIDGSYAFFWNYDLVGFNSNLSKLENGDHMFYKCDNLTQFSISLPSLTNGRYMFYKCDNLTTFSSDLPSLTDGYWMFNKCDKLTTFYSDLPSLINGREMFYHCFNLESFSSDSSGSPVNLSSLIDGSYMFSGCALTSFSADVSSLIDGQEMFMSCDELTTFNGSLSSLKSGRYMFYNCKLDAESLYNIADNINDLKEKGYDKNIDEHWTYEVLGKKETITSSYRGRIDIWYETSVAEEDVQYCGNKLIDKGWDVYFNGTLYKYATPYDVSEANGYIPDAYKSEEDNWNAVVLTPYMDILKISEVNAKGEMLNDD